MCSPWVAVEDCVKNLKRKFEEMTRIVDSVFLFFNVRNLPEIF